jgi:hypothetical protein
LPVVKQKEQGRPALKAKTVNEVVQESEAEEQALYVIEESDRDANLGGTRS